MANRVAPRPQGTYKKMHAGLVAGVADAEFLDDEDLSIIEVKVSGGQNTRPDRTFKHYVHREDG
jgi:hypothetical protein